MEIKKLELKKKTISVLSNEDLANLNGGEAEMWTTSFGRCTGDVCCPGWIPDVLTVIAISVIITTFPRES